MIPSILVDLPCHYRPDSLFDTQLVLGRSIHYGEFMNAVSKLFIGDFKDKISFYTMNCVAQFKSDWSDVKANAALFTGVLSFPELRCLQCCRASALHVQPLFLLAPPAEFPVSQWLTGMLCRFLAW